jgi:hypothetical protein
VHLKNENESKTGNIQTKTGNTQTKTWNIQTKTGTVQTKTWNIQTLLWGGVVATFLCGQTYQGERQTKVQEGGVLRERRSTETTAG